MNILSLDIQNVLRLEALFIKADGKNVVLSGKNGAGKSSVLRAIEIALGGKEFMPEKPVHEGHKKGKVTVDLGDFVVTRTITEEGGGTLTVTSKDGAKYPSPQSVLDGLLGSLTFDPLAFSRMKPKEQAETLKKLVGLDFTALDAQRTQLYDDRTVAGRDLAAAKVKVANKAIDKTVPGKEVSVSDLMAKLTEAQGINAKENQRDKTLVEIRNRRSNLATEITELEEQLQDARQRLEADDKFITDEEQHRAATPLLDTTELTEQIASADSINAKIRENQLLVSDQQQLDLIQEEQDSRTEQIDTIDKKKQAMLAGANFPLTGLAFTDAGVTLNGLPFEQASMGETLRASAAIGMALNPKLRILMIRDASLIDEAGMKMLAAMATEKDCQLWLERVGDSEQVSVVIEEKGEA
jgi:predicted ATP-dependent endonuclease of OLD family